MKNKEEICEILKEILGTPKSLIEPYDDTSTIFQFQQDNEEHVIFQIETDDTEGGGEDLITEENEIEIEGSQEVNEAINTLRNKEIDSDDDNDLEVKKETRNVTGNRSSMIKMKKISYSLLVFCLILTRYDKDDD